MIHKMKLKGQPFNKIKNRTKTIEMRLWDEKRSIISVDDVIEFTNTETNEICECVVINLYRYESFNELYKNHNKTTIGYTNNEIADPDDMLAYYSAEEIEKYGVLGIEIKVK